MKTQNALMYFGLCLLLPICNSMDADNGEGSILRNLPCVQRLNQLVCTSSGNSYPDGAIGTFIDDNKALLRRMYGELQLARTVTKTTVRIVQTFGAPRLVAIPLIQGHFASSPFKR